MTRKILSLPPDTEVEQKPKERIQPSSRWRTYIDRGRPGPPRYQRGGGLLLVKEPKPVERVMLTLQAHKSLQRQNGLQIALLPTHRTLLRWAESGGTGLPNPEAEIRELHYDPLPPDLQQKVDDIVDGSPWEGLTRRWYRTNMTVKELAESLCTSRAQLYIDWRSALWYYRGRFESAHIND